MRPNFLMVDMGALAQNQSGMEHVNMSGPSRAGASALEPMAGASDRPHDVLGYSPASLPGADVVPTVLVVQPFAPVSGGVRASCTAIPACVLIVDSPAAAIEVCVTQRPDLVVIDVDAFDGLALQAIVAMRALPGCSTLPIVVMSIARAAGDVRLALASGSDGYLLKPVQPLSLIQAALRLLDPGAGTD